MTQAPVSISLTPESRSMLLNLERKMPRTMRSAFGAAATRAQNRFRKVMKSGGGVYGVPHMAPHHPVSTQLRPGQQMGGVLAERSKIVKYRTPDGGQYIGWPDGLAKWAARFQDSATRPFSEGERGYMRWRRVKDLPPMYQRPERDVVDSFAADLARDWPDMVIDRFNYYYRKNLEKYGAGNFK